MHLLTQRVKKDSKAWWTWDMGHKGSLMYWYFTQWENCVEKNHSDCFSLFPLSPQPHFTAAGRSTLAHISTPKESDTAATVFPLCLIRWLSCHSTLPPSGALRVQLPPGHQKSSRQLPPSSGEMPALQHFPQIQSLLWGWHNNFHCRTNTSPNIARS